MGYKNDLTAKQAFIQKLLNEGFEKAEIKSHPADILAEKNGETWYFEIKLTDNKKRCFGAATQTEWAQALKDPDHFRFVIAIRHSESEFEFRQFTPIEFMKFSTIPPFKVYFNVDFTNEEKSKKNLKSKRKAVQMTEHTFNQMNNAFLELKK